MLHNVTCHEPALSSLGVTQSSQGDVEAESIFIVQLDGACEDYYRIILENRELIDHWPTHHWQCCANKTLFCSGRHQQFTNVGL